MVPTREHGQFYSLTQSPQQVYKNQLLKPVIIIGFISLNSY